VLYVPFIRQLFRFSMLHVIDLLICSSAGVVSVLWFDALKIVTRGHLIRG
jgi:Ca2+-transporting ATPase